MKKERSSRKEAPMLPLSERAQSVVRTAKLFALRRQSAATTADIVYALLNEATKDDADPLISIRFSRQMALESLRNNAFERLHIPPDQKSGLTYATINCLRRASNIAGELGLAQISPLIVLLGVATDPESLTGATALKDGGLNLEGIVKLKDYLSKR